jgi:hypothetical protein
MLLDLKRVEEIRGNLTRLEQSRGIAHPYV